MKLFIMYKEDRCVVKFHASCFKSQPVIKELKMEDFRKTTNDDSKNLRRKHKTSV